MNEYKFYLKTYFLDLFAYFMCMGVLPPCMCWNSQMAEKSFQFPGTAVMDDCQLPCSGTQTHSALNCWVIPQAPNECSV